MTVTFRLLTQILCWYLKLNQVVIVTFVLINTWRVPVTINLAFWFLLNLESHMFYNNFIPIYALQLFPVLFQYLHPIINIISVYLGSQSSGILSLLEVLTLLF